MDVDDLSSRRGRARATRKRKGEGRVAIGLSTEKRRKQISSKI